MQKEHYAGLKSSLLDHLDLERSERKKRAEGTSKVPHSSRKKMGFNLDSPDKPIVDSIAHGIMETNGLNICEVLNSAIEKTSISTQLAEMSTSMGLMFEEVVETVDRGKVTAYWIAPEMDSFLEFAAKKNEKSARRMKKLLHVNISQLLQKSEPKFRAYLVKKMDFRRVPMIDFLPYVEEETDHASNEARQAFLREQAKAKYELMNDSDDLEDDSDEIVRR